MLLEHWALFASLEDIPIAPPNGVFSSRKEFSHRGANSFLQELTPIKKGGEKVESFI